MIQRSHATPVSELPLVDDALEFSRVEDISSSRGVWRCPAGIHHFITEEEFFTIIQGKAIVRIDSGPNLSLEPGVTGNFRAGEKICWEVFEPILKSYQKFHAGVSDQPSCSATLATNIPLDVEPMEEEQSWVTSGNPDVTSKILATYHDGRVLCGVWRCSRGSVTYVEADEIFTVIEGHAMVTIGNGSTLELSAGVTGEFKKGDIATFCVQDTFLKTFQITL